MQAALEKVKRGEFRVEVHGKLELQCHGRKIQKPLSGSKHQKSLLPAVKKPSWLAVNDVIIRNKDVTKALRFQLRVGKNQIGEVLIGDGIVVSTPFGSSGYFFSIAQSSFSKGVGIAFNNPTIPRKPLLVGRTQKISMCVVRNNAVVAVDNDPRMQVLREGDIVEIQSSKKSANIVRFV